LLTNFSAIEPPLRRVRILSGFGRLFEKPRWLAPRVLLLLEFDGHAEILHHPFYLRAIHHIGNQKHGPYKQKAKLPGYLIPYCVQGSTNMRQHIWICRQTAKDGAPNADEAIRRENFDRRLVFTTKLPASVIVK
jgi:hypothetical protein